MNSETERQELLFVWTENSSLSSRIVGWSFHDGNDPEADAAELPHGAVSTCWPTDGD